MIKKKKDAKDFFEKIVEKGKPDGFGQVQFTFWDSSLFVGNWGGHTTIGRDNTGAYIWSYGKGWRDQQRTYREKETLIAYIYDRRKDINKLLKKEPILFL